MRIIAVITPASVIDQILTHLRARAAHAGARSALSTRAPASRGTSRAPRPSVDAQTVPCVRTPEAPLPRGDVWRARPSHRGVPVVPAGPWSPARTTGRTAHEAHRRRGGRAVARAPRLARQGTGPSTQLIPIEIPIPKAVTVSWKCGIGICGHLASMAAVASSQAASSSSRVVGLAAS